MSATITPPAPDDRRPSSLVGDSSLLFAGNLAVSAISFVGTAAMARVLTPEDWGGLTFLLSLASFAGFLFDFSVGRRVLAEAIDAGDRAREVVGSFVGLRLTQGVVAYGAMVSFVAIGPYPGRVVAAAALIGTVLLFDAARTGLTLLYQLELRFRPIAGRAIASRLVMVALIGVLVASGTRSLVWFVLPSVADASLFMVLLWMAAPRGGRVLPVIEPRRWWPWIKEAIPLALGSSIAVAYFRVDAVMISMLDGLTAAGMYAVGYKFCDLLAYFSSAVRAPLTTLLVKAWPGQPDSFQRNARGAFILLSTVGLGVTATFCIFAEPAISFVFGDRYRAAAGAARLVAIGQGMHFVTALQVTVLVSAGRHRVYPLASLIGLLLNVGLNLYLIPRYSYSGAAFATVVTEVAVLATLAAAVRAIPGCRPVAWAPLGRAVVATVMLVVVGLALEPLVAWPVAALAAGLTFAGTLHLVGVDGPGGLRVVPHLLQRVPDQAGRQENGSGGCEPTAAA